MKTYFLHFFLIEIKFSINMVIVDNFDNYFFCHDQKNFERRHFVTIFFIAKTGTEKTTGIKYLKGNNFYTIIL